MPTLFLVIANIRLGKKEKKTPSVIAGFSSCSVLRGLSIFYIVVFVSKIPSDAIPAPAVFTWRTEGMKKPDESPVFVSDVF